MSQESLKQESPAGLNRRSWKYVFKKTLREFLADKCTDIAATLTYFSVLALFPSLIAIFSLLGVIGRGPEVADAILEVVDDLAPGGAADLIRGPIEQFVTSPAAGFALVSGMVLAIWSASGYVRALSRAMNRIYGFEEGRPFWKLVPLQLLVTLLVIVIVTMAGVILVMSGPVTAAIGEMLGLGATVTIVWSVAKWPLLALLLVVLLAILFYVSPNAKQPKFRWLSLGAVLSIVVMAIATTGFGLYVANFSNYNKTYGSLAGIIVFLLWLWIVNNAVLLGAEFDAELERGRELQAGIPAERDIKLPTRDDRKIVKNDETERRLVDEGQRIRKETEANPPTEPEG